MESGLDILTLDKLNPGEKVVIKEFIGKPSELDYLFEMGLLEDTTVKFVKKAPLGDPIEISFRGYHLSIRKSVAKLIIVEKAP